MAFSLTEFKKTSRTADGRRVLYPHQLRDDRYLAAIAYTIDFYERHVGRPRHEMQAETLLEFFGDPRLARGIVACLARSYIWHEQSFAELLDVDTCRSLAALDLTTPARLRAHLYDYVNQRHAGFLPVSRQREALAELCASLPVAPAQLETLLALDSPSNAILTKVSGTPDAREIVALYNYHSLETALSYAEALRLTLRGDILPIIRTAHNVARRYPLDYTVDYGDFGIFSKEIGLTFRGGRDALGSYRGSGRRIVRALLRLLAAHPEAVVEGEATVHIRGRVAQVLLDKRALRTLGARAASAASNEEAWEAGQAEEWRIAWSKAFVRGETHGWRLRRDPEPIITEAGVIVPDFGLQRGPQRASLILAPTAAAVRALTRPLGALAGRVVVVVVTPPEFARKLAELPVIVLPSADTPSPRLLATTLPAPSTLAAQHATKWQRLEQLLAAEGYVDEGRLSEMLEVEPARIAETLRGWRRDEVVYLPGIGLCTGETVSEIRSLLQPERRRAA